MEFFIPPLFDLFTFHFHVIPTGIIAFIYHSCDKGGSRTRVNDQEQTKEKREKWREGSQGANAAVFES